MNIPIEFIAVITSVIAGIISSLVFTKYFRKKTYKPENAIELLKKGKSEVWNEVRIKYPEWIPDLANLKLSDIDISNADLSYTNLAHTKFENVIMADVSFNESNLAESKFVKCELNDCSFKKTNLSIVKFDNCKIENCIFLKVNMFQVKFDNTIIESSIIKDSNLTDVTGISEIDEIVKKHMNLKTLKNEEPNAIELIERISGYELENLLKEYFEVNGYTVIEPENNRDIGFDFSIERKEIWGKTKVAVEVKKVSSNRKIHTNTLHGLYGLLNLKDFDKILLITTGTLSSSARELLNSNNRVSVIEKSQLLSIIKSISSGDLDLKIEY